MSDTTLVLLVLGAFLALGLVASLWIWFGDAILIVVTLFLYMSSPKMRLRIHRWAEKQQRLADRDK